MRHEDDGAAQGARGRRRGAALIALALFSLSAMLLMAVPALADISDGAAEPFAFFVDGGFGGNDTATDVVVGSSAIWVAGQAATPGGLDASLVRIPTGATVAPPPVLWNGRAGGNDVNDDLAVKGSFIYTSGTTVNAAGDDDLLVIRWTATGAVKWARSYAGAARLQDRAEDVAVDAKGNVYVCGSTRSARGTDWIVIKYSSAGSRLWTWKYDGPFRGDDAPVEMLLDARGQAFVTGWTRTGALDNFAALTVKISPAGKTLWKKTWAGPAGLAYAAALAPAPGGGVYVGGHAWAGGTSYDAVLLRYTANGARKVYELADGSGGAVVQRISDIAVAANGKIVGVGQVGPGSEGDQYHVIWDAAGPVYDEYTLATPSSHDYRTAVATDAFNGYYMTGMYGAGVATVRSSVNTWIPGAHWSFRYEPDDTYRDARAIAVRGTMAAAVGTTYRPGTGRDQFVFVWAY